jgi:CRISPR-associated protein Csm1
MSLPPEQQREYRTVILGALLHDIGKYLQRGDFGGVVAGQHPQVGAVFVNAWHDYFDRCVDANLLRTLVQRHHESHHFPESLRVDALTDPRTRALARLVSRADNLASSERAPREPSQSYRPFRTTGLAPIFNQIELTAPHTPPPHHFHQEPLTATDEAEPPIFAREGREVDQADVTTHIKAFGEAFDHLAHRLRWDDFDCVYSHILSLLHTYAWCLPSDTQASTPDVSLYDHLRVTSAIAACLYQFHAGRAAVTDEEVARQDQTRCLLLVGDISGIQDYIFDISTTGAGGVAKRLRARSFYVQLLGDTAGLRLLNAFRLPLANLLMAAGGKFYLLLPNLPDSPGDLHRLQREFDRWLLAEFHGALALNLAWIELSDSDFAARRYGAALARLHTALQRQKTRRLASVLQEADRWGDNFAREPFAGESVCLACYRFPARHFSPDRPSEEGPDICDQCAHQLKLGRRLTTAPYVSFLPHPGGDIACLGWSVSLGNPHREASLVVRLNNPDLSDVAHFPAVFRYLANHVPRDDEGAPHDFSKIAGRGLLGVLKADVDYLGQIFQEGLRRDEPAVGLDTVSRLAALSRQLEWFFSGWLEWLLTHEYPNCYTVYSGGDDLLLVGSRENTLDLAQEIQRAFARYTRHPEITLSAGLAIVKPGLPLAHTVVLADDALEKAKASGRNRLSVLGSTFRWEAVDPFRGEIARLVACEPRSSFLYHLLYCGELWSQYRHHKRVMGLRYHPLLAYYIARNVNTAQQAPLRDWAVRLLKLPPQGDVEMTLDHLRLIAQWVLLEMREK